MHPLKGEINMLIKKEIELPEEIILSLRLDEDEVIKEMKRTLAVKYFKERKLSIGQSAEFAEMTEEDFIKYLGSQNISIFNMDDLDELKKDLGNCSICKGNLEIGNINHIADLDNFIIIIKNVPAFVCKQCGEYYLEHNVALEIEKIIDNYRENTAEVIIINYFDVVV